VAAGAQAEGQREEGKQVAGGADRDDDVVGEVDGGLLLSLPLLYAMHVADWRDRRGRESWPSIAYS
jgi:hypothetical protein